MDEQQLIQPRILAGFRDYSPAEVRMREAMMAKIRRVFELFGFEPLDTTTIEFMEILTGKTPGWDQMGIYDLDSSLDKRIGSGDIDFWSKKIGLRFDLTVSLARYVAMYLNTIPRPFRRYQIGKVYRAETPQEGRYREFLQFDADIMFAPDVFADAEIIAMMIGTMQALDISEFKVKVNNRKIAEGLPMLLGVEQRLLNDMLKILDKRDKIGRRAMIDELKKPLDAKEPGIGMNDDQVEKLMRFAEAAGGADEKLTLCRALFAGISIAMEGVDELEQITKALRAMGMDETKWEFDFSVVRGLSYYTGPVFETQLTNLAGIGSVFSGGRFDNLVSQFANARVSGTGASVGVDRLLTALMKLEKIKEMPTGVECLILRLTPDGLPEMRMAAQLRAGGVNTMVFSGEDMHFKVQFNRAVKFDIPFVVIIGDNEMREGKAAVKNLKTREQILLPFDEVGRFIREKLATLDKL